MNNGRTRDDGNSRITEKQADILALENLSNCLISTTYERFIHVGSFTIYTERIFSSLASWVRENYVTFALCG